MGLAVFLSGFGALAEELVWLRLISTLAGSDALATGLTLAIFLLGLGLGNFLAARIPVIHARRSFAAGQIFVGLTCIAGPFFFRGLLRIYESVVQAIPAAYLVVGVAASFAVLLLPCMALGMAVPLALAGQPTKSAGPIYGMNNLGAVAGIILSGFWLLEQCGLRETLAICAVLHGIAVAISWRRWPLLIKEEARKKSPPPAQQTTPRAAYVFFASASFALAGLEVIWTRALANGFMEVTVYSFTCVLASTILGMAVGGFAGPTFEKVSARPWSWV